MNRCWHILKSLSWYLMDNEIVNLNTDNLCEVHVSLYLLTLTNIEIKDVTIYCRHCRLLLLLDLGQQYYYKIWIGFFFFLTFFQIVTFRKNIWKFHHNSEKHFRRKVLEKGNKNKCILVPSNEWLFYLIFVSFLMTTESSIADIIQISFFELTMLSTQFYRHIL